MQQLASTKALLQVLNKLRKKHLLPCKVHDVFIYSPYANETMCWINKHITQKSKVLHASSRTEEECNIIRNKFPDWHNLRKSSLYDQLYEESEYDFRSSAKAVVQSTLNSITEQYEKEEEEESLHFTVLSDSVPANDCALWHSSTRHEGRQQSQELQKRNDNLHHTCLPISLHDLACYVKAENAEKTTHGHLQSSENRLMLSSNSSSSNECEVENRFLQSLRSNEQGVEYHLQNSDLKLLCERGSSDLIVLDCTQEHTDDCYTSTALSSSKSICGNSEISMANLCTDAGVESKELVHNALIVATHLIHPNGAFLLVSNSSNKVSQAWQVNARWQFNEVISDSVPLHDVNYMYCTNLNLTSPHKELDKRDFPGLYGKGVPRPKHWNPYERRKERQRKIKYHSIRPRFTGAHRTGEALLSSLEQQRESEASQRVMDDALFEVTHNMVDTGAYDSTVDN